MQPVLFGHAFINPKDVPFLAFFIAGLALGLYALPPAKTLERLDPPPHPDPSETRPSIPRWLLAWTATGILLLGVAWLWRGLFPAAQAVLAAAYDGQAPTLMQRAFDLIATDAWKTPLPLYAAKLSLALRLARYTLSLIIAFGVLLPWGLRRYPGRTLPTNRVGNFFITAAAGMMIGLDTSIRAIAPIALLPLAFLFLLTFRRRSWPYLGILFGTAAVACYASWPFLWLDPIGRFIQSVETLSQFPWVGHILFNGQLLSQGQQPWFYIPELILLQLTLPVLALTALGAWIWLRKLSIGPQIEIGALLAVSALPVAASMQPGTIVYNNFRQLLFTLPVLFLIAGLGFDWLSNRLQDKRLTLVAALLTLAPGFIGIIRLHPYEYIVLQRPGWPTGGGHCPF